ncbi:hypothetical protein PCASD_13939 [Puccinia coronata f. sp. avenae]|uniref:Uncharacterized protein n=1 Tax=Puccinia coronata f. sp. avenae TaxID=200324 RepID=A0A2N5UHA4_9BASI|nr:hypothetical protein PCASD_13939 [Puccinia coronata f. sp. avenae]
MISFTASGLIGALKRGSASAGWSKAGLLRSTHESLGSHGGARRSQYIWNEYVFDLSLTKPASTAESREAAVAVPGKTWRPGRKLDLDKNLDKSVAHQYTPATVRRDYPGRELGIVHEIALAGPGPNSNGPQILGKLTRPPRDFPQDLHVKILWRVRLDLGTRPGTSRDA